MAHLKKTKMPKSWPVPRKGRGKRFVAVPSHSTKKGISILFLLRDVLGIASTRKEVRYMTLNSMVRVNNVLRKDENFPCQVFDVLNLCKDKESRYYRLEILNRKFSLKEIGEKEAGEKIVKIIGKTTLQSKVGGVGVRGIGVSGEKKTGEPLVQMNLDDGCNILTTEKFAVGDSVVLGTAGDKVVVKKILGLKNGAKVEIVLGKHAGEKGEVVGFEELVRGRDYVIKLEDKTVSLPYKTVLVIG